MDRHDCPPVKYTLNPEPTYYLWSPWLEFKICLGNVSRPNYSMYTLHSLAGV